MEERLKELELQLRSVVERLTRVEQRLDGQASEVAAPAIPIESSAIEEEAPQTVLTEGSMSNTATHLGRTLLIFGGAYFLRALTDFEFIPPTAGVLLGAAYALVWLFMADRAGGHESQRATAVFYGIASVVLGMPLLVEAATRFQLLSGGQAAASLTVFCGLVLVVAARRNLQSLAWLATLSGIPTALILLRMTHQAVPFSVFLVLLGLGSLWVVYLKGWKGLHWLGAIGADLGVAIVALLGTTEQWIMPPNAGYLLGLALLVAFPASFAIRSHLQQRTMGAFEVVQGILVIAIVFWAANVASAAEGGLTTSLLGILMLIMGVGSYSLAFTHGTRTTRGRNFFFYTTVGLILVVGGSALVMPPGKAAAAWSLMAVLMAFFSGRYARVSLSLQCTLLILAAGVASGIFATGFLALTSSGTEAWPTVTAWHLIVAIATVACLFIPVAQQSERWGVMAGLPQLIVLALSVWEVGGLMVAYLAPAVAGVPGPEADLGALAALRTVVLTVSAVTLALSSRHKRWPEARWLVYPVLALVGIKLILEDFPNGRPLTLFIALALVGGALILVAKLLRRQRSQPAAT
jgi:hypothetical protein